jgi:hypothetical protein
VSQRKASTPWRFYLIAWRLARAQFRLVNTELNETRADLCEYELDWIERHARALPQVVAAWVVHCKRSTVVLGGAFSYILITARAAILF